eukprot:scaffold9034_cov82-Phaeocystis_antarctica.AAC.1
MHTSIYTSASPLAAGLCEGSRRHPPPLSPDWHGVDHDHAALGHGRRPRVRPHLRVRPAWRRRSGVKRHMISALMKYVAHLGGVIFFTDPLFSHPHAADIATLLRMCDLHNILHASNPTTARALIPVLRDGADGAERHGQKGALSCSMQPDMEP